MEPSKTELIPMAMYSSIPSPAPLTAASVERASGANTTSLTSGKNQVKEISLIERLEFKVIVTKLSSFYNLMEEFVLIYYLLVICFAGVPTTRKATQGVKISPVVGVGALSFRGAVSLHIKFTRTNLPSNLERRSDSPSH